MPVAKIASIIAKKRAADIAKKKVAKVPAGQARKVAKEEMKNAGKRPGRKISKRTGLSEFEKAMTQKRFPVEKREFGRSIKPKDVIFGRVVAKEEMRKKLATPPSAKRSTSKRSPVQLTRGGSIAKRSEVEEVAAKRLAKQERNQKLEYMLKKMDPADRKRLEARAQIKRAQRDEAAGKTKYGMDIKSPRERLDEQVVERAKELTVQERNEIARKQAMEFAQRRESDKRVQEALKEISRRERMQRGKR
jgi:hypothetical protein